MEQLGASKPVSHMAQRKTRRRGSSGSLNFSSRPGWDSFIRFRWGAMSRPNFFICSISFCPGETMRAMSVPVRISSRCRSSARSAGGRSYRPSSSVTRAVSSCQCFLTLSCIFRAVALSMDTTMAFPTKPRPRKCRTMSAATVSSRSSRVMRWYWRPKVFSSFSSSSSSRSASSMRR
ncbi:MAG: hypothetical protein BWY88_01302 [Synergistetes bacterium ADurb.Bin520]|nr:MAG: hypothetical protein BWY88_01302 [Synergistetes bacterium ADurb.Bin520]